VPSLHLPFSILGYSGDVFTPTVPMITKLSAFWHKAPRCYMNCFTCTLTDIPAIDACLPPLELPFSYKTRLAGQRILCSPPDINPATACLPHYAPTPSLHRHAPDHRVLLRKNAGSSLSLPWLQLRPPSKHRAHFPLDAIPHSLLFLLSLDGLASLPFTSQHLLGQTYPTTAPWRSYPQLQWLSRDLLMNEWEDRSPDPDKYPYQPSLKPYPFIGFSKFDTGRLYQMRSGKTYLRAHPAYHDDCPPTCPRCNQVPKSL